MAPNFVFKAVVKFFCVKPPSPTEYVVLVSVEEIVPFDAMAILVPAVSAAIALASVKYSLVPSLMSVVRILALMYSSTRAFVKYRLVPSLRSDVDLAVKPASTLASALPLV